MYGNENQHFRWLSGDQFDPIGWCATTDLPLSEADANSETAVVEVGNMLDIDFVGKKLVYTTGNAVGFLAKRFSKNGVIGGATAYYNRSIGARDLPDRRGAQMGALRVPRVNTFAEFEGLGAAAYGNFVITATTTGFLSAGTTLLTELTVTKGGWRAAQTDEFVIGLLESAVETPLADAGNLRIVVRFVSPYRKKA